MPLKFFCDKCHSTIFMKIFFYCIKTDVGFHSCQAMNCDLNIVKNLPPVLKMDFLVFIQSYNILLFTQATSTDTKFWHVLSSYIIYIYCVKTPTYLGKFKGFFMWNMYCIYFQWSVPKTLFLKGGENANGVVKFKQL